MYRSLRAIILVIALIVLSSNAGAELFRVALSTKDFGYLPLYVGMRSGLFGREGLEIQWIVVALRRKRCAKLSSSRLPNP